MVRSEGEPLRGSCSVAALLVCVAVLSGGVQGAQTEQISGQARSHLTEIISVLREQWLHRGSMDWSTFEQQVFEKAGAAKTIPDTYDAIRLALTLLGDRHSYYVPASGDYVYNPQSPTQSTGECTPPRFVTPPLPADVGYVRIQITPATPTAAIQDALRKADGAGNVGWIVDLRNSRGGNMWPAITGIGSVLGDGTAGFFIDAANRATPWGYTDGGAWGEAWLDLGEAAGPRTVGLVEPPYRLLASNPRVAVLTDIGVASSGEAVAIAFRGRPNTRSFGTPTCGLSTAVEQLPLATGGRLGVVTGVMADRTMKKYGAVVEPDELETDPAEVVPRALAWLRGR